MAVGERWVMNHDPSEFPESSTTYEGYLWKITLCDGATGDICVLADLDEIAVKEIQSGRV